jgi:outer membrane receptor protein involved in Fe transport
MRYQDRIDLIQRGINRYLERAPTSLYSPASPYYGSTPNIASSTSLVLKNGAPLTSNYTYVPAGTPANVGATALAAALLANAGKVNLTPPDTTQPGKGLRAPLGFMTWRKDFSASVSREMTRDLELFADFTFDHSISNYRYGYTGFLSVPASSPANPFLQAVTVNTPTQEKLESTNDTNTEQFSTGFVLKLPRDWRAEGDYTWSSSRHRYTYFIADSAAISAAVAGGAINPFVDTLAYNPQILTPYSGTGGQLIAPSTVNDQALRLSGPAGRLPAGAPQVAIGLENRWDGPHDYLSFSSYAISPASLTQYLGHKEVVKSAYVEAKIPLVSPANQVPFVHLLDLQATGRTEQFRVNTGTSSITLLPVPATPPAIVLSKSRYESTNPVFALRYAPLNGVMFRADYSTAFLPPTFGQLFGNGTLSTTTTNVTDPRRGNTAAAVYTMTLGNAALKPQTTRESGCGVVLTPAFLPNFRLSIDYVKFRQKDVISSLALQTLINDEALFPGRVIRGPVPAGDPYGVGPITVVDTSSLNLTRMETSDLDLALDYRTRATRIGAFTLGGMATLVRTFKVQTAFNAPFLNYDNFVDSNYPAKLKLNGTLGWEFGNWGAGWSARYTGPTYLTGTPRDPAFTTLTVAYTLNGDHVPGQIYHDAFVRYRFSPPAKRIGAADTAPAGSGESPFRRAMSGVEIEVGLKNVFNTWPPFSSNGNNPYFYSSSFGDPRLRSAWLSVKKDL